MEEVSLFASIVTPQEWQTIPSDVATKITNFVTEKFEEMLTSKALLETNRFNSEQNLVDLKSENSNLAIENDSLKSQLANATEAIAALENQSGLITNELNKLQMQCNKLEMETAEFRRQRNAAIDERDEHLRMSERRTAEVNRMQVDITSLRQQLETAITTKCEAIAQLDEIASMKDTLELREKQIERDRGLMMKQIEGLSEDLKLRTDELLNMRRDNMSRCVQLETQLNEKMQELLVANEQVKSLNELNASLNTINEELTLKMQNQHVVEAKMDESYRYEIDAKTKMAETYKGMYEESQKHANELGDGMEKLQELLREATEKYGVLETEHKEDKLAHEEIILKKNDCIAMLKKELEATNDFMEHSKHEQLQRDIEGLSPQATSTSRFMKSGMTMTQMYAQTVELTDKLTLKDDEIARLTNYIGCIVREIEDKGPMIKKLRYDFNATLEANEVLKTANEELLNELQQVREANSEKEKKSGYVVRENERLKKEVNDLGRQVCKLLNEVEHSRIGSSSTSNDMDLSDSHSSADIISKKLVTFADISEMQANNQKLIALVRDLSERQEEVEAFDPAAVSDLKLKLEDLRERQKELLEERDRQTKMMNTLRSQREMYKNLYGQAVKVSGDELDRPYSLPEEEKTKDVPVAAKSGDYEREVESLNKKIASLQEENDTYRKEKTANEKILIDQLDSMRNEAMELNRQNCKLVSQVEMNEEKIKTLHNNLEIFKKQIVALEKQNKIYGDSIIKHEQASTYLKDETFQSQTKLSRAEVMLGSLQKENALLRDAEQRLLKERESSKTQSHQQNLIQTNIELIKATLERADAEGKLRLESRLDEAHRECAAMRRRLQEEQDTNRQTTEYLTKQTTLAQERMEEEKAQADKLRDELTTTREELISKTTQIEELTMKIKLGVLALPDEDNHERRGMRELENQLSDAHVEIQSLKAILKTAKDASEQYFNLAEASEKQNQTLLEERANFVAELEARSNLVKELQEKCSELQGELSIQMDDQDIANASINSKRHELQEELNVRSLDLRAAREQLQETRGELKSISEQLKAVENKYAREVMLHSVDLQTLTTTKGELDAAVTELMATRSAKDQAIQALEESKRGWLEQEKLYQNERAELQMRFKDLDDQNTLLLDQIQALNTNLTVMQQSESFNESNVSNRSMIEDETKSSEQLLKIIRYLRQEKDLAVNKADIIDAEHQRLKSQFDIINKQLEEAKMTLENDRQKSEISKASSAKHADVLRRLETLNAITDSNRSLRQERDELLSQVTELRERTIRLESELSPLQEINSDLSTKADQMQNENLTLRAEATRWRQRANILIEKSNRTSPEDWKKLQTERENLAKQLTIERSNTTKLTDDVNTLRAEKARQDEQLKNLRLANTHLTEEVSQLKDAMVALQSQAAEVARNLEQLAEEKRVADAENVSKDGTINELKNNLGQIRKIAKKYKTQSEDYLKEIESLKAGVETAAAAKVAELSEQRGVFEERITALEASHRVASEEFAQQINSGGEMIEQYKRDIDALKQSGVDKEDRFKTLFKNAKERIVSLTDQNQKLKEELDKKERGGGDADPGGVSEYMEKIDSLEREKVELIEEHQQEKEKLMSDVEVLTQRVNQLQRQLGLQQGSKPSTSSGTMEKSTTEPPTANIKPMAGHSTNTQTQSASIQPWRSGGEPPLASIRPMSAQLRTVAVLPTSQSPSAVMVPPQQQVHTTGSSTIEALSSSPTSSHTDYVPATSSASPAMLGPRQVAVPPTQSSQDDADEEGAMQVQAAPQQQAVALVLPRIEPPSSGPTQEQGTSSSSSNTVTTTQAGLKRQREADTDGVDEPSKAQLQCKRTRVQAGTVSDSGLDVEYQVPTSSQRDHDDDNVIVVESDEEGGADEGEGADDDQDDPDTESYEMEGMEQDNYEDGEVEDEEEAGNEVEVIEDSSEVPNQSERSIQESPEEESGGEQAQSEAISSGTDGAGSSGITFSQASTSASMTIPSYSRSRPVAPLSSSTRQQPQPTHLLLEEGGDDGIVPSTPTLFVPRRSDGFGEAVSSPHVPTSGRFTFNEQSSVSSQQHHLHHAGSSEVIPEQTLEVTNMDDNSTGRSVPTTPLQSSPQEVVPGGDDQGLLQGVSDAEIPIITVSGAVDESEPADGGTSTDFMGPPGAGTSSTIEPDVSEELVEADDEVSSEGEKPPVSEEGGEEEGREAEASPSTNTRFRNMRNLPSARRSRQMIPRGNMSRAGPPTPIVWQHDPRNMPHQMNRQQQGFMQDRGRGGGQRSVSRRSRGGRMQRPFGRF